jgi:hypothetical protein
LQLVSGNILIFRSLKKKNGLFLLLLGLRKFWHYFAPSIVRALFDADGQTDPQNIIHYCFVVFFCKTKLGSSQKRQKNVPFTAGTHPSINTLLRSGPVRSLRCLRCNRTACAAASPACASEKR